MAQLLMFLAWFSHQSCDALSSWDHSYHWKLIMQDGNCGQAVTVVNYIGHGVVYWFWNGAWRDMFHLVAP